MAKKSKHLEVQGRYIYNPEIEACPHCGERLRARPYYEWRKTVQHLTGTVVVVSHARVCGNPRCAYEGQGYKSAAAQMVTLPHCTYGLDVIAQIGWWRDREHLNRGKIHERLRGYGVQLSEREVDHLYARYQVLLGCAERLEVELYPVICYDERPCFLIGDRVEPVALQSGQICKEHYAYEKLGSAALLAAIEPLTGRRLAQVQPQRTKKEYTLFCQALAKAYPDAIKIRLIPTKELNQLTLEKCIQSGAYRRRKGSSAHPYIQAEFGYLYLACLQKRWQLLLSILTDYLAFIPTPAAE